MFAYLFYRPLFSFLSFFSHQVLFVAGMAGKASDGLQRGGDVWL